MAYFKKDKFERRDSGKSGGRFRDSGRSAGGRRDFDQQDNFGRSDYERPSRKIEHEVICDKCSKKCIVPFKPNSNKPIYCDDCFRKKDSFPQIRERSSSSELEEINRKLDIIIKKLGI